MAERALGGRAAVVFACALATALAASGLHAALSDAVPLGVLLGPWLLPLTSASAAALFLAGHRLHSAAQEASRTPKMTSPEPPGEFQLFPGGARARK